MSQKQSRKIRQIYRRELRGEVQHFETSIDKFIDLVRHDKPKWIPQFIWDRIIRRMSDHKLQAIL